MLASGTPMVFAGVGHLRELVGGGGFYGRGRWF